VITTSKNWPVAVAHSAVAVGDQVYVFGGRQTNASSSYMSGKHVWRFKPSSGEWNYDTTVGVGSVPPNLNDASAVAAGSLVYVFGGWDGTGYQSSLRSYDTGLFREQADDVEK
jgi:N-acetylneuraminic acid mutarotase